MMHITWLHVFPFNLQNENGCIDRPDVSVNDMRIAYANETKNNNRITPWWMRPRHYHMQDQKSRIPSLSAVSATFGLICEQFSFG